MADNRQEVGEIARMLWLTLDAMNADAEYASVEFVMTEDDETTTMSLIRQHPKRAKVTVDRDLMKTPATSVPNPPPWLVNE